MASLIAIRLYKDDGTPKISANPKLSAIREKDNKKVLDSVDMEEVGEGFYKYEFKKYDRNLLYFFYIDGEVYDNVNQLDAYGNKHSRGTSSSLILDEDKLKKKIWSLKESEIEKDTIAEHLYEIKNQGLDTTKLLFEQTAESLNKNLDNIMNILEIQHQGKNRDLSKIKSIIEKIPKSEETRMNDLIDKITHIFNNSYDMYIDDMKSKLAELENKISEEVNKIGMDDFTTITWMRGIKGDVYDAIKKIEEVKEISNKNRFIQIGGIEKSSEKDDNLENEISDLKEMIKDMEKKNKVIFTRLTNK